MATAAAPHGTLARAQAALERGRGDEAVQILAPLLRGGTLARPDQWQIRAAVAEAWLLQNDLTQAAAALGRTPDALREPVTDADLSALWRLHGRIAFERGEHSRAIALQTRALKHAELAHDSRAIGLAHYELAFCYKQVGDTGIVRDHLAEAASALHAAGDRRCLALVHRLFGVLLAQAGRVAEATAAWRQAERLAMAIPADDVLAGVVNNQATAALMLHRHEQALELAERSVALHERVSAGQGQAVALATLGQILVQMGDLRRAEEILTRTLEVRNAFRYREVTGAVFDSLTQIHLMRGSYERAADSLRLAADAYGASGAQTMRWYEWSIKVLEVRLAIRRGEYDEAIAQADAIKTSPGVPPADALEVDLAACEALVAAGRADEAAQRLAGCEERLDPRGRPGHWGEFLRIRGTVHERSGRPSAAYHDLAQSVSVFELVGERYDAALSQRALGRLTARAGDRTAAVRHLDAAESLFRALGADHDLAELDRIRAQIAREPPAVVVAPASDVDEAIVRRLVDASMLPALLARETATTLRETTGADAVVVFVALPGGEIRMLADVGCDGEAAGIIAAAAAGGARTVGDRQVLTEYIGRAPEGPRWCAIAARGPIGAEAQRRLRMFAAVVRQGFDLCGARERPQEAQEQAAERSLEPLLPGFICASAAMSRVAEQIQRLQGHDLTVLITGESGTGKDLVARAIHGGSLRSAARFLPYNCTTTSRELADSQLFGHRRGSFTGAVSDQQGLIRAAAGGTLFLDEIGDLPLDIQPKLLRFLEQGEVLPVGETRPQVVDVRVLAATNADLEQRVTEGRFREDLYYRLSVIRIQVPPLRERREEIPHLSTFFLREACERLGKPDVTLDPITLDLFARYWWPGNVRQLRNEIQRAVAMSAPGGIVGPDHLSAEITGPAPGSGAASTAGAPRMAAATPSNLADAVAAVERELITSTLERTSGNISETARTLGLTRRGLYLKMRRLGLDTAGADL